MTATFNTSDFKGQNFTAINTDFRGTLREDVDVVIKNDGGDFSGVMADVLGSNEDILKAQKTDQIGVITLVKNAWAFSTKEHGYGDYDRGRILNALKVGDSVTLFARC